MRRSVIVLTWPDLDKILSRGSNSFSRLPSSFKSTIPIVMRYSGQVERGEQDVKPLRGNDGDLCSIADPHLNHT